MAWNCFQADTELARGLDGARYLHIRLQRERWE